MSEKLTERELIRYKKQIMLPETGVEGQQKLKDASVLVVGAGGLGCPVLQYLTAAGVGTIGIVEFDMVDESNLQRQILYGTLDRGKLKSIIARERLEALNDNVKLNILNIAIGENNADKIISEYDVVVDATDNFEARYVMDDVCRKQGKPLVHGAIYKYEGMVSVFNYKGGASYRDFNPDSRRNDDFANPSDAGLFGVLPGITGTLMANEVIKIVTEKGEVLSNKMLVFNTMSNSQYTFEINSKQQINSNNHETSTYQQLYQSGRTLSRLSETQHCFFSWKEEG